MAYRKGSQPPQGYVAWHEWAAAQAKAGLKQQKCPQCEHWFFPQEHHDYEGCCSVPPTDHKPVTKHIRRRKP
jgi:hypothetical protein